MELERLSIEHGTGEWLTFRKTGIGGSDAAAILGLSPFKTNVEVWEEKVGLRKPLDISANAAVRYGKSAEELLVQMFALDYPEIRVKQDKAVVYRRGHMFASLDAELESGGEKGFLEIKTTEAHSAMVYSKWDGQIPTYYYTQVLHYFVVTGWAFAYVKAQIKQDGRNGEVETMARHYMYRRERLMGDLRYLYMKEKEFWGYVERRERPSLLLPTFERVR